MLWCCIHSACHSFGREPWWPLAEPAKVAITFNVRILWIWFSNTCDSSEWTNWDVKTNCRKHSPLVERIHRNSRCARQLSWPSRVHKLQQTDSSSRVLQISQPSLWAVHQTWEVELPYSLWNPIDRVLIYLPFDHKFCCFLMSSTNYVFRHVKVIS